METINDVLSYLNKLDFTNNIYHNVFENFRCGRRLLVKEFEDYNISELIDVLSIVDNLIVTLTVGELQNISNETDTLGGKTLYSIGFEHFVENNSEFD